MPMENEKREYPSGIKWTKQRKDVYHILEAAGEPMSAARIYNAIVRKESDENYAVSTIYRILAAFEEKGIVSRDTWMGDGSVVYELNRGRHTHYAVCLECHRRIPLHNCPFVHIPLEEQTEDFTVTGHKLELYGYCRECGERKNHRQNQH